MVVVDGAAAAADAVLGLDALVVVALVVVVDAVAALVAADLSAFGLAATALSVVAHAEAAHVGFGLVVDALVIQLLGQNFFGLYPAASVSLYPYPFPALARALCSSLWEVIVAAVLLVLALGARSQELKLDDFVCL